MKVGEDGAWRATADEDGHYCFAVALSCRGRPARSGRITNDGLRPCAKPYWRLSSQFHEWSGHPSIAAISINPGNGAMGHNLP